MAHWHKSNLELVSIDKNLLRLSPVKLLDLAVFGKDFFRVEPCEEDRREGFLEGVEGVLVEVVVVVMADEDSVDVGQIADLAGWWSVPFGANPLEG